MTLASTPRHAACLLLSVVVSLVASRQAYSQDDASPSDDTSVAATLYEQKCVKCHGAAGQGVIDQYEEPLIGDLPIDELARVIERTMPEEDPETCVGEEARLIAEFIYDAFYSPEAQQRQGITEVPRIELSRLTVPQYRNAVADLIGHFTPVPSGESENDTDETGEIDATRGLAGEYFQSKGMSKANQLGFERVDARIDFDFGENAPAEDIPKDQFAIVWQGSLVASDTGYYEFRLRTQNGARMYLNNDPLERRGKLRDDSSVAGQAALLDAWVSSGEMREETARVFLLGGRLYPLRVEFFKYMEKTASIRLEWKQPHGTWTVLDNNYTVTAHSPRVFVATTPFPADDRSLGYERGSSVSPEWQAAINSAAIEVAAEVVNRLPLLSHVNEKSPNREEALRDFVGQFARVAFRRPLTPDEEHVLRENLFQGVSTPDVAVRRAVLYILNSPYFLYTELFPNESNPYQAAARLSFALWDSIPDSALIEAADQGQLNCREQLEKQAVRMLADSRTRAKMRGFFHDWLEIDERDLSKDKEVFPEFDETVIADLRYSLELFIDQVVWSDDSDYRELLMADYLVLNDRLKELYGITSVDPSNSEESSPSDKVALALNADPSGFDRVTLVPNRRAGILTHPYLLSAFAYHNNTSPIHRGVFLTRNIVGRTLKPPPIAVAFKDNEFAADLTMREKITELTRDHACMACHSIINPLGFALENYDAVGRWRTVDNNKPVDTTSQYTSQEGATLEFQSARDIANFAVSSEPAQLAFVTQVFRFLVKQAPNAFSADTEAQLHQEFVEDGCNIQHLLTRIAVISAQRGHQATPQRKAES